MHRAPSPGPAAAPPEQRRDGRRSAGTIGCSSELSAHFDDARKINSWNPVRDAVRRSLLPCDDCASWPLTLRSPGFYPSVMSHLSQDTRTDEHRTKLRRKLMPAQVDKPLPTNTLQPPAKSMPSRRSRLRGVQRGVHASHRVVPSHVAVPYQVAAVAVQRRVRLWVGEQGHDRTAD